MPIYGLWTADYPTEADYYAAAERVGDVLDAAVARAMTILQSVLRADEDVSGGEHQGGFADSQYIEVYPSIDSDEQVVTVRVADHPYRYTGTDIDVVLVNVDEVAVGNTRTGIFEVTCVTCALLSNRGDPVDLLDRVYAALSANL